jgi:hypothetical protein
MIRKITYLVTKDTKGITPNTIQWAGMQYEDCATEVIFDLSALDRTLGCNYRIDFNSDGAGYHPSKNLTLKNGKISRTIPKFITQYGGELQITAVVTSIETTEVVYSYPVKVRLTPVDKSQHGNETVEGNLSEMEESVKDMTRRCEDASYDAARFAKSAENDRALTEEARFALEHDSEFVFLGGDASGSASTELVVDGVMSDASKNPVMNKVAKKYVDDQIAIVNAQIASAVDYIVEQGGAFVNGATWDYEKWASGKLVCNRVVLCEVSRANLGEWGTVYESPPFGGFEYPFSFVNIPIEHKSIVSSGGYSFWLCSAGADNTNIYSSNFCLCRASNINSDAIVPVKVAINVVGKWK